MMELVIGEKIEEIANNIAGRKNIRNINETKIPLVTVTCETVSMKEVNCCSQKIENEDEDIIYIYDMPIGKAVRSSMSFPGIYTTCNYQGYNLIDGGTKNNMQVDVLKKQGADKIISVSFDLDSYKPSNQFFDVVIRALDIFSLDNVRKGREKSDVAAIVKTEDTSLLEIKDTKAVIDAGYNAVMEHKEEILEVIANG
ncbi:MAG: hypothetical protein IJ867_02130 [Clostridia bacterium]|nr:hypothetical protein [Clostridia bacterium]